MKNDRLDAALDYVRRRGWQVFPVPPGMKCGYSIEKRGFDNGNPWGATKDESEVREYWRRLPRANIGLVMGVGSGIWDLEYDTVEAHGVDGAASLAALEAKYGALPATLMFESPSGSRHHLFLHPGGDLGIRAGALDAVNFPGIDVKGDNSMSIMPPSRTHKGQYKWLNNLPIAPAQEWSLAMVIRTARAPRGELNPFEQFAREAKQASIAELTLALAMIPNGIDVGRKRWIDVGLALWSATGGSEEGYQLFLAWSRRWPGGCNEEKTRTFWGTIKEAPHSITAGSIFHWAGEAVPDYMSRIIAREPDVIALLEEFWKLLGEP
jgi:Bifunctional DNA primase/polymerase, N-terminal/Primase C terminal 2 (PriCT-2)